MSIQVKDLTKSYGKQLAVNKVSFEIHTGEIVGFIGPNGAGKTTTMKLITGYIPPDSGVTMINDLVTTEHIREIRSMIGYLPEHNPLYPELFVREYLAYVAGLYGIKGANKFSRIKEIIHLTGLDKEAHKKIGALSKGFRQRVGLAQALIHDPEILILDEPTSGLDPNQIIEIRNLISEVGKQKTVMLSTHIMQEVEAICDRVIIINNGNIVADEKAGELKKHRTTAARQTIQIELDSPLNRDQWASLPWIQELKHLEGNEYLLETTDPGDIRKEIFNFAVSQGLTILSMSRKEKSLEEVFRELTNR